MAGLMDVAIGVDQLANTLIGGTPDETLSARSWRLRDTSTAWRRARKAIDAVFGKGHCEASWRAEVLRAQLPKGYRK
jgi:hypothetical protein